MQQALPIRLIAILLVISSMATRGFHTTNWLLMSRKHVDKYFQSELGMGDDYSRPQQIYTLFAMNPFNYNEEEADFTDVRKLDQSELFNTWDPNNDFKMTKGIFPVGPPKYPGPEGRGNAELAKPESKRVSQEALRYFNVVEKLAPNDLLLKFAQTTPKHVQEGAKTTIMNILGSLPNYALDAALITTNHKLANLLYQMQITGYMFKNAEYRMSLTRSLRGLPRLPPASSLNNGNLTWDTNSVSLASGENNEVSVRTASGEVVQVNVQELTGALSGEIAALRQELSHIKNERENELKRNLLTYIQALPERELAKLTSDISEEVVQAIRLLVQTLINKLGVDSSGPEVVVQQGFGQLAQLCMWQMVVGYKLRELEALEKGVSLD